MTSHTGPLDVPFALCPFASATFYFQICVTSSLPYSYCSRARAWRGQLTHTHPCRDALFSGVCATSSSISACVPPVRRTSLTRAPSMG